MARPARSSTRALAVSLTGFLALLVGFGSSWLGPISAAAQTAITAPTTSTPAPSDLWLVTLTGPGTAGDADLNAADLRARQDRLLASIGAAAPRYRWTTALNGFAVPLTDSQVETLRAEREVALVEPNEIRPLAHTQSRPGAALLTEHAGRHRGGRGVVVGVIDSGIAVDSPVFSASPALGKPPAGFTGGCAGDEDSSLCNGKVLAARWFVEGYGEARLRSSEPLSPRDVVGHGTQVASVIAGNARVSLDRSLSRTGQFAGVAPQARLAIYKACWSAPNPDDDGCATADVVAAVDQAITDGVDVLNLSIGGGLGYDTLDRALLGAAEADIVVVAAAGNAAESASPAAHPGPWVTTVGGLAGADDAGALRLRGGPTLRGTTRTLETLGPRRIVLAAQVRLAHTPARRAARCLPGTLDAGKVVGRIVVCQRGSSARVAKSDAVALADGVGMVLINQGNGATTADLHAVPTIHLDRHKARRLVRWVARHRDARASVAPARPRAATRPRVARWSAAGAPASSLVKPDLVAAGTSVLAAIPPRGQRRWDVFTGTSAAAAEVAGAAALIRARQPQWDQSVVRAALSTTAQPVGGAATRQGAGALQTDRAVRIALTIAVRPRDYRGFLDGVVAGADLNVPSLVKRRAGTVTRTVVNTGDQAAYWSSQVTGFPRGLVRVSPAAMTLQPGQRRTFTVRVSAGVTTLDTGALTWTSGRGQTWRMPIVLTR